MLLAAAVSVAMLLIAACGGGDDNGGSGSESAEAASESGATTSGSASATGGGDSAYVRALCEATGEMEAGMEDVLARAVAGRITDESGMMLAFVEVFERFRDGLEDANPPSDMRATHDAMVVAIGDTVDLMKSGDPSALEGDSPLGDLPGPPSDVDDRLSRVAEDEPACQSGDLF